MTDFKTRIFKLMDETFFKIKKRQDETQEQIDAIVIQEYVSALEENRRLCNEHREAMKCNLLV